MVADRLTEDRSAAPRIAVRRALPGVTDVALLVHAAVGKEPRVALAITVASSPQLGSTVGREEIAAAPFGRDVAAADR